MRHGTERHFWGALEVRPWMWVRLRLAFALRDAGRLDDATVEFTGWLRLNESDNQGVRDVLLPLFRACSRLENVRDLMKRYPGGCAWSVAFACGQALERDASAEIWPPRRKRCVTPKF